MMAFILFVLPSIGAIIYLAAFTSGETRNLLVAPALSLIVGLMGMGDCSANPEPLMPVPPHDSQRPRQYRHIGAAAEESFHFDDV